MGKTPEILAPCSTFESVKAAVSGGANAIYVGSKSYSARANAKNFEDHELLEVVNFCHSHFVKVYLALNTLIKDNEIAHVLHTVKMACDICIDALIVQDMGLATLIKKSCPQMKLHASTQLSVNSISGVNLLKELGFSRVVLARELTYDEIKNIVNSTDMEIEVFVHGALCMSVSGQCYLSSIIGTRSGNRGRCAQPCRLEFSANNKKGNHHLSLKDLSLIPHSKKLLELGVHTLKIEGRMKRPEYVYQACDNLRYALDNLNVHKEKYQKLENIFSREGFTDGYFTNNIGKNMFGSRKKEDVISATTSLLAQTQKEYQKEVKVSTIDFYLTVKHGENVTLLLKDIIGYEILAEDIPPQKALNVPISYEKCETSLRKTGNTPYTVRDVYITLDSDVNIPISTLNNLRRSCLENLTLKILDREKNNFNLPDIKILPPKVKNTQTLRAIFTDTDIPLQYNECEIVFIPLFSNDDEIKRLLSQGFTLGVVIPSCTFGNDKKIENRLNKIKELNINHVYVNNIGAIYISKKLEMKIHGGYGLNILNSWSVKAFKDIGLTDFISSFELMATHINQMSNDIKKGAYIYGRLPLMTFRNCPMKNVHFSCSECRKNGHQTLTDRLNKQFPIICDGFCSYLLNCNILNVFDKMRDFSRCDFLVLNINVENYVEKVDIFNAFKSGFTMNNTENTKGLYYRAIK